MKSPIEDKWKLLSLHTHWFHEDYKYVGYGFRVELLEHGEGEF